MDRFEISTVKAEERSFEYLNMGVFGLNLCEMCIQLTSFQAEYIFIMAKPSAVMGDDLSNGLIDFYIKKLKQAQSDIFISSANLIYLRPYTNDDAVRIKIRYFAKKLIDINLEGVTTFVHSIAENNNTNFRTE